MENNDEKNQFFIDQKLKKLAEKLDRQERQERLDKKVDEVIYHMCNLVDDIVDAEEEEDYGKCFEIKKQIDALIVMGAIQLYEIGTEITTDEIMKHLHAQYLKILEGVRNFDNIYIDLDND